MKIKWVGGSGVIPQKGILNTGDTLDVNERKALSFIKQGLAEKIETKKESITDELRSKK